ncbi:MAG TPA: histidine phosphotransferase family protein [Rubellimicrobium sp.]|nr:histidine phosphotransferase family protein [Rubellimicrobium sp.]
MILSGAERTPEMDLIAGSIESANARIRFFRLAYGSAGPQPIARAEVLRTLEALARGSRTSYEWKAEGDHPRIEVKAVLLLLQCLEAGLPMGGRLQVTQDAGSWIVRAEGPRLRLGLPAWQVLSGRGEQWPEGSAVVQFVLLEGVLASLGRSLSLSESPDRIEARF